MGLSTCAKLICNRLTMPTCGSVETVCEHVKHGGCTEEVALNAQESVKHDTHQYAQS